MSLPKQKAGESDEDFAIRMDASREAGRKAGRRMKERRRKGVALIPDLPGEQWRPVVGYEGFYEVSNMCRVKGLDRMVMRRGEIVRVAGVLLKMHRHSAGYWVVDLRQLNVRHTKYVHRLVLEAFVGPCPEGEECRHLNGDRADARLENLAWGTRVEQAEDRRRHGTLLEGETAPHARFTAADVRVMRTLSANGVTDKIIGMAFDAHPAQIAQITNGNRWKSVA